MATFNDGEQRSSIRTKINASITKTDAMDQGVATTDSPEFAGLTVDTDTLYVDSATNLVGIGTSSPNFKLVVDNGSDSNLIHVVQGGGDGYLGLGVNGSDAIITAGTAGSSELRNLVFRTAPSSGTETEHARIDASGSLLVGTTTANDEGISIRGGTYNYIYASRASGTSAFFDRLTSDGNIVEFRKDGSTVGSIGSISNGDVYFADNNGVGLAMSGSFTANVIPCDSSGAPSDNLIDLGASNVRFDDIYATNGTIQTSDVNEKQDIEELSDAEQRVAVAAKGLLRKYRWKDAVAEKGDAARIHFGIIAQDLQAAFEAEGLDAGRYAMFIITTWWESEETYTDDDGVDQTRTVTYDTAEEAPEGAIERTRMGVRYSELLAFIIGAM